jgi:ATP-dependent DNA helicase RecG
VSNFSLKPGPRLILLPDAEIEPLAESLVALANATGGLIILGMDEHGQATDPVWEEEAEAALLEASRRCLPPVVSQWRPIDAGSQSFVGIDVPRSLELHSLVDGRVFIRSGSYNRPTTGDEIQRVAAGKSAAEYETESLPGARMEDFDQDVLDEYLKKRESRGVSRIDSMSELLFEIGAVDHNQQPTVAGILLFGRRPQAFLPQSGVVFVRFAGTDHSAQGGGASYGRRDEISGPLARVVERAWNIIWEEMRVGAVINGLERTEQPEYPPFPVREALINAVAHRDYRIRGRRIEVRMYDDRMEVISPGGLPGYMTLDNLVDEHYSRNPRIVNGLFQWGYIEELGLGIDQMIEDMVQNGHGPPSFEASPHLFTVKLYRKPQKARADRSGGAMDMNERQTLALQYVRDNGSISNRELQQICPDVSSETLRLDLSDLVERGILLKIGSKRGTHYIMK